MGKRYKDGSEKDPTPRIFLTYIEGANYPFITVLRGYENEFKENKPFNIECCVNATKVSEPQEVEMTIEQIEKALKDVGIFKGNQSLIVKLQSTDNTYMLARKS